MAKISNFGSHLHEILQDENVKFCAALAGAVGGPKSLPFVADGGHQEFPGGHVSQ